MWLFGGNIALRAGRETKAPPWPPQPQRWAPGRCPAPVWQEGTKCAFDRRLRCGTEVSRRLAAQRLGLAMAPPARSSPSVRSVEEQRLNSDRGPLFELLPGLEAQE